jgi:hypothetical protein
LFDEAHHSLTQEAVDNIVLRADDRRGQSRSVPKAAREGINAATHEAGDDPGNEGNAREPIAQRWNSLRGLPRPLKKEV